MSSNIAIVVSRFNEEITSGLLKSAKAYLTSKNINVPDSAIFWVRGAFELPLIAQVLAGQKRYDGVICLGCIIKGDTAHFEFISLGASLGVMQASLATETPISFGILTTYTDEQAEARSGANESNKGTEAAAACLETISILQRIRLGDVVDVGPLLQ